MMNLTAVDESQKAAHTPTPWKSRINISDRCIELETDKTHVASVHGNSQSEIEANAAFIVRAVNSYNDLLIIAKEALCELDPDCKYDGERWERGMSDREGLIIGLYEAIAKAEGK